MYIFCSLLIRPVWFWAYKTEIGDQTEIPNIWLVENGNSFRINQYEAWDLRPASILCIITWSLIWSNTIHFVARKKLNVSKIEQCWFRLDFTDVQLTIFLLFTNNLIIFTEGLSRGPWIQSFLVPPSLRIGILKQKDTVLSFLSTEDVIVV